MRFRCIERGNRAVSHSFGEALDWFWPDWVGWPGRDGGNRPRQWCCCPGDGTPIPRTSAASACTLNAPKPPPRHPNHRRKTHIHPSSTSIISPSLRLCSVLPAAGPPPLDSPRLSHQYSLQLQICLHRLKRPPMWQRLNTGAHKAGTSRPVSPKDVRTHVHTLDPIGSPRTHNKQLSVPPGLKQQAVMRTGAPKWRCHLSSYCCRNNVRDACCASLTSLHELIFPLLLSFFMSPSFTYLSPWLCACDLLPAAWGNASVRSSAGRKSFIRFLNWCGEIIAKGIACYWNTLQTFESSLRRCWCNSCHFPFLTCLKMLQFHHPTWTVTKTPAMRYRIYDSIQYIWSNIDTSFL